MAEYMKTKNTGYRLGLSFAIFLCAFPALAIGKRDISVKTAENGVNLSLSRGYGVVVNLSTIGQTVSTAWLSDPSQITLASNKGPCTGDACSGASVLYLKPIDRLNFPGLPSAADGGSLLSVITNSGSVLQFKLSVTSSSPSYTSVALIPERQRIIPPLPRPTIPLQQATTPNLAPVPKAEPEIVINLPRRSEIEDIKILAKLSQKKSKPSAESKLNFDSKPEIKVELEPQSEQEIEVEVKPDVETEPEASTEPESNLEPETEIQPNTNDDDTTPETQPSGTAPSVIAVLESEQDPTPIIERTNQEIAGAILRGLHSQRGRKEVGKSVHYRKAQDVIWILKKNKTISLSEAIRRARMDENVAKTLINYGTK